MQLVFVWTILAPDLINHMKVSFTLRAHRYIDVLTCAHAGINSLCMCKQHVYSV